MTISLKRSWLLLLLSLPLLASCIRDELDDCPPLRVEIAVKDKIMQLMRQNNAKSYKTAAGSFTYVPPTTKKKFDSAKLKEDDPDLYDKYTKESTIAASLRIKLKK